MANQKVILPHTSVLNKVPDTSKYSIGELFVNGASGDASSFLSTLKSDGTIAKFHEDKYWQNKIDALSGSTASYELQISDDGIVTCVKNGTDEGFQIDDEGVVSLL